MQLETPRPCSHKALVGVEFLRVEFLHLVKYKCNKSGKGKCRIFSGREWKINCIISQKLHTSHNENFLLQLSVRSPWGMVCNAPEMTVRRYCIEQSSWHSCDKLIGTGSSQNLIKFKGIVTGSYVL